MTRYLVTGGRDYKDRALVFATLDALTIDDGDMLPRKGTVVMHGGATGADRWADEWCVVNWVDPLEFKADWRAYGRMAGPMRNERMLREGLPDVVIAFPGGAGTNDMIHRARRAGIEIRMVGWD